MNDDGAATRLPAFAVREITAIAAVLAVVLLSLSGRYGYHRDELYFLAAGRHPAWGYVDQPPLTPMLARVSTAVFGDSVVGLRVVALLLAIATVFVAALITRELGGGRGPQILTAAAVATSSMVMVAGHMLGTPSTDILIWALVGLLTIRLLRTQEPRWYAAIGFVVGIGFLNKFLVALLAVALLASIALLGPRRILLSWWLPTGIAIAALVAAPTLVWQAANDWPQLTVAQGISDDDGAENRIMFIPSQFILLAPPYAVLWIAGIWRMLRDPDVRWSRSIPVAYGLLVVVMLVTGGKPYYVIGLLIVLLAAGAQPVLGWFARRGLTSILVAVIVVSAVLNAVVTLPVLPRTEVNTVNGINREQGEQIGWPQMVDTIAEVWESIPESDRSTAVIFTQNYGQAGAVDRYGPERGLPQAYSGHMSYADWGPPGDDMTGPVILVRFPDRAAIEDSFVDCRTVARVDNGYGVDNTEQGTVVALCSGPRGPWSTVWPDLRHYY
ncbi:glycosyltransferase family 39 protein [Gordonia sp. PKS22-38]|uniref:Glycosyltransferase family 39 protein n=1 Tax=Gordonia prachuapensis TaxID=3115651 RepID=A0ABU7N0C3_9ACTN|nr:glycosyltransferase family 39 protein [Gordonia sp. PKS22-38]